MTRDDILKLVRESYERGQSDLMESCKEAAVKAIESAILAEREACAKVCDKLWNAAECAEAIRARSNP